MVGVALPSARGAVSPICYIGTRRERMPMPKTRSGPLQRSLKGGENYEQLDAYSKKKQEATVGYLKELAERSRVSVRHDSLVLAHVRAASGCRISSSPPSCEGVEGVDKSHNARAELSQLSNGVAASSATSGLSAGLNANRNKHLQA